MLKLYPLEKQKPPLISKLSERIDFLVSKDFGLIFGFQQRLFLIEWPPEKPTKGKNSWVSREGLSSRLLSFQLIG
jgi:hypothetical protein